MPQMGESIAEGTIVRWIKKVGDTVERDEPLFEISTDKVDAEIPSPAAGVVTEIRAKEGETVPVNSVVAVDRRGWRSGDREIACVAAQAAPAAAAPRRVPTPRRPPQRRLHVRRNGCDSFSAARRHAPSIRRHRRTGASPTTAQRLRSVLRRSSARSPRNTTSTSARFRARASPAA